MEFHEEWNYALEMVIQNIFILDRQNDGAMRDLSCLLRTIGAWPSTGC